MTVRRNSDGGLGVIVDQDNCVVSVSAQPALQPGDVIMGVDGAALASRPVGQCLTPGAPEYVFSIKRPASDKAAETQERVLLQLAADRGGITGRGDPSIVCVTAFDEDEELAERLETVVASLEAAAGGSASLTSVAGLDAALSCG